MQLRDDQDFASEPSNLKKVRSGLVDNYGRKISYLRLAITDRCNLRCRYCRPANGVPFVSHDEILRFEELHRLTSIFCELGINKVRVTGGEPFSRRGCLPFLEKIKSIEGLDSLHITTNGVKTARHLYSLAEIGISGINLSLDTLDDKRFWKITRRNYLDAVLETFNGIIKLGIPLKINSVVLGDTTDHEIKVLAELARKFPITLRFIEMMPFSGGRRLDKLKNGGLARRMKKIFPSLAAIDTDEQVPTTARLFAVPDFKGKLGIIEGYSRLFCKTCNKIRITPAGMLKTCLYDNGVLNLKRLLRNGADDTEISRQIVSCINNRFANGHEAELTASRDSEPSMAKIGG